MITYNQLNNERLTQLRKRVTALKIPGRSKLKRKDAVIKAILDHHSGTRGVTGKVSNVTGLKPKSSIKPAQDVNAIITITCGDVAENHIGNQQIGNLVAKGQGFNLGNLENASKKFKKLGYKTEIFNLNKGLDGVKINGVQVKADPANIMVIRNGVEALIGKGKTKDFYNQLVGLDWDKKFWDTRRKKVLNKHARHNLCFSNTSQEPDYPKGKGRIVSYDNVPHFEENDEIIV